MAQVSHDARWRRLWMVPRNKRAIPPWKIAHILNLLVLALSRNSWPGNQHLQDAFCKALESADLKRPGLQRDAHSGGPRTYLAQLVCLGLTFKRDDGNIFLTRAGEAIVNGEAPAPILRHQLLRLQYPSVYSLSRNVALHPEIRVRPFILLLRLIDDHDLRCLTDDEVCICVALGHTDDSFGLCKREILRHRAGVSLEDILQPVSETLYTRRRRHPERKPGAAFRDLRDIANTFGNYMLSTALVNRHDRDDENRRRSAYCFDEGSRDLLEDALATLGSWIPSPEDTESFQRAFGVWDRQKDTRHLTAGSHLKQINRSPEELAVRAELIRRIGPRPIRRLDPEEVGAVCADLGVSSLTAEAAAVDFMNELSNEYEVRFRDLARGRSGTPLDFELSITSALSDGTSLDAVHTGKLKRQAGRGGYADVRLLYDDGKACAIIDAKASSNYGLPIGDHRALTEYSETVRELPGASLANLESVALVAGGYDATINKKLSDLSEETDVTCTAITAEAFLRAVDLERTPSTRGTMRRALSLGGLVTLLELEEMLREG